MIDNYVELDSNSEGRNRTYHYVRLENNDSVKVTEDLYDELDVNGEENIKN